MESLRRNCFPLPRPINTKCFASSSRVDLVLRLLPPLCACCSRDVTLIHLGVSSRDLGSAARSGRRRFPRACFAPNGHFDGTVLLGQPESDTATRGLWCAMCGQSSSRGFVVMLFFLTWLVFVGSPHTARHGGPSEDFFRQPRVPAVQMRGHWEHPCCVERYKSLASWRGRSRSSQTRSRVTLATCVPNDRIDFLPLLEKRQ